jgi:hypothetical protein
VKDTLRGSIVAALQNPGYKVLHLSPSHHMAEQSWRDAIARLQQYEIAITFTLEPLRIQLPNGSLIRFAPLRDGRDVYRLAGVEHHAMTSDGGIEPEFYEEVKARRRPYGN